SGRIVLADDNADMRAYVSRLLGERWVVTAVADGAAALAAAKAETPDIVVADVMMPEMDGFELLMALREEPSTRSVPVILLSARAGEEATLKGLAAGADDYLIKPFSAKDLLARVDAQWNRAQARRAVRGRMAQIESLLDNAPLGVYLVDQDFRIAHINPVACATFGDIPGLVGRDFDSVIHLLWNKDYADEIVRLFRHTLETGEPSITPERAEYRIDRGAMEYYEWRVVRIQFPDGRFGVVCYFQDISWLVRARNAIAESEQRFRAFVTATVDVVYRMNADWSEMRHLDGRDFMVTTAEPSRKWLDNYIHADDQPGVLAAVRKAIDTKTMFELEHRVIRVDGTPGWTLSRAVPILDADGNIVEWFGTARDVTSRRESEETLARIIASSEQQRRLYETILANTLDLVYVFDRNHRFTFANDALLAMWGKTWNEAIGKNCLELGYEPWHAAMHDREIDQVIATKQPIRGEVPFTGTAGRRMFDYIFVPVLGINGEVEAVAGTTRDITDRKRSEDALRRSQHELTEANRVKDEFLAMLGHELRNPLAPISTAVQLIRMRGGQSREIAVIDRQVGHLTRLVDDLLDVSRITRGKIELDRRPIEIWDAVARAMEVASPLLEQRRHLVDVDVPSSGLVVEADIHRLAQVISNLLTNAAKYSDPESRIMVRAARVEKLAKLTIKDEGVGIPAEMLSRVFDAFVQQPQAIDRSGGGLGLGLAIVRSLVTMHGGTVRAESLGTGLGSEFVVELPIAQRRRSEAATSVKPAVRGAPTRRRVLVVDDNEDAAEMLAGALVQIGYDVAVAHDAPSALERAREFDPEVA
ncbi:MAG TPA: PAS domain-containing protein, partial [Vicinamibacterales bacterium]